MSESNDQFRTRLHSTGQGEAFRKRRSELQSAGASVRESWEQAATEFGWEGRRRSNGQSAASYLPLETRAEYYQDKSTASLGQDARWVYDVISLDADHAKPPRASRE